MKIALQQQQQPHYDKDLLAKLLDYRPNSDDDDFKCEKFLRTGSFRSDTKEMKLKRRSPKQTLKITSECCVCCRLCDVKDVS
jgi:hypothetical protein